MTAQQKKDIKNTIDELEEIFRIAGNGTKIERLALASITRLRTLLGYDKTST